MRAKKKINRPRVDRRIHCSIDTLPTRLQTALEQMILSKEWPRDFKGHYNGIPRYIDMVQYCKKKGYAVSESALGRLAQRIQNSPPVKTVSAKTRPYILSHLAEVCREFADIQDDLLTAEMHPKHAAESYNPTTRPEGKECAQRLVEGKLNYIEQAIKEVRRLG